MTKRLAKPKINTLTQPQRRIWLYKYPVDMRKQIDGLCALVADRMGMNPQNGDIFVFFSHAADRIKLLFWENTGFVLVYKRLEAGHFQIPQYIGRDIQINAQQLISLLQGVVDDAHSQAALSFSDYY